MLPEYCLSAACGLFGLDGCLGLQTQPSACHDSRNQQNTTHQSNEGGAILARVEAETGE